MIVKTLTRIKKLWALSKVPDLIYFDAGKLDEEQLKTLKESGGVVQVVKDPVGDGNASFFGEPTPEEQLEHERELEGTKGWYDRLKKLI